MFEILRKPCNALFKDYLLGYLTPYKAVKGIRNSNSNSNSKSKSNSNNNSNSNSNTYIRLYKVI